MFDLGAQELIVIFIVAFLVFGPKRLPELARSLGKGLRELKAALMNVKETLEESDLNISKEIKDAKAGIEDSIKQSVGPEISKETSEEKKTEGPAEEGTNKTSSSVKNEAASGPDKDG
jgi:TatA/E family protein of Tat protein translocase